MKTLKDIKKELMKDSAFRKAYEVSDWGFIQEILADQERILTANGISTRNTMTSNGKLVFSPWKSLRGEKKKPHK